MLYQAESFLIQFQKVTSHLQLLQNTGFISHGVQHFLEPILHSIVCTSHSPIPVLLVTTCLFSSGVLSVSLILLCYIR